MRAGIHGDVGSIFHRVGIGMTIIATVVAILACAAAPSKAATINTYTFVQGDYATFAFPPSATVQGSFSGYVEPDGMMYLSNLISFHVEATGTYMNFRPINDASDALPTLFSFNTMGGNSTFNLVHPLDGRLCIGPVTSLACGVNGLAGALFIYSMGTTAPPQLTLVSSMTVTPIPAPLLLFATALSGLGAVGWRVRRQARAV